jgi:hypothetical protein
MRFPPKFLYFHTPYGNPFNPLFQRDVIPPEFPWIHLFHRNFVGLLDGQSFVPKGHVETFL